MGALFSLLGFAFLALWAGLAFGIAGAVLVTAVACFVIGIALSDVSLPKLRTPKAE